MAFVRLAGGSTSVEAERLFHITHLLQDHDLFEKIEHSLARMGFLTHTCPSYPAPSSKIMNLQM